MMRPEDIRYEQTLSRHSSEAAYMAGKDAYFMGIPEYQNPYLCLSIQYLYWRDGWNDAKYEDGR